MRVERIKVKVPNAAENESRFHLLSVVSCTKPMQNEAHTRRTRRYCRGWGGLRLVVVLGGIRCALVSRGK